MVASAEREGGGFPSSAVAAVQCLEGEVFAGADGFLAGEFLVAGEAGALAQDVSLEPVDELGEGHELFFAGPGLFEVADKADADGALVEAVALEVTTEELLAPAWADLDLAVAGVDAVAYDEVVGQSIFHAAAAVSGIVLGRIAKFYCTVVDDDGIP